MGDAAAANVFLVLAGLSLVGAFWSARKDRGDIVFGCLAFGAMMAGMSVFEFTWGS